MKPVKPLKFKLQPNQYYKIDYVTSYSRGTMIAQVDTYLVNQKKFQKVMKDCLIERMVQITL